MQIYPNHESTSHKRKRKLPFFSRRSKPFIVRNAIKFYVDLRGVARAETRFEIRNLNKDAC